MFLLKNGKFMDNKYYYYFGYEIVRKPHYVDAHKHYDYVITDKGMANGQVFDTLTDAKKYIKDQLYGKSD